MKVAELVTLLQSKPQDMDVVIADECFADIGILTDVWGPDEECPNAVYLAAEGPLVTKGNQ